MPGYCAWNALPSFSPTGRSIAEYSTTLPSRLAASISCGVMATGSGAAALTGAAKSEKPSAADPLIASRLDRFRRAILVLVYRLSARQRSGGKVSHTCVPGEKADCGEVTARKLVPSDVSST